MNDGYYLLNSNDDFESLYKAKSLASRIRSYGVEYSYLARLWKVVDADLVKIQIGNRHLSQIPLLISPIMSVLKSLKPLLLMPN